MEQLTQPQITVTLARVAPGLRANKVFYADKEPDAYDAGWTIKVGSKCGEGLSFLYRLLDHYRKDPSVFIMRGKLREGANPKCARRRYRQVADQPAPDFELCDQSWVCIDCDTIEAPRIDMTPMQRAEYLLSMLPTPFQDAGCIVQWSSSAGRDGWKKLKAHLWFVLDRPAVCLSWREYIKAHNASGKAQLDAALYNPVQPHYIADPTFVGLEDPCPERLLMLDGPPVKVPAQVLSLAQYEAAAERARLIGEAKKAAARAEYDARQEMLARRRATGHVVRDNDASNRAWANAAFAGELAILRQAAVGEHHNTIRRVALNTYGLVAAGVLDETRWETELRETALALTGEGRAEDNEKLMSTAKLIAEPRRLPHQND